MDGFGPLEFCFLKFNLCFGLFCAWIQFFVIVFCWFHFFWRLFFVFLILLLIFFFSCCFVVFFVVVLFLVFVGFVVFVSVYFCVCFCMFFSFVSSFVLCVWASCMCVSWLSCWGLFALCIRVMDECGDDECEVPAFGVPGWSRERTKAVLTHQTCIRPCVSNGFQHDGSVWGSKSHCFCKVFNGTTGLFS